MPNPHCQPAYGGRSIHEYHQHPRQQRIFRWWQRLGRSLADSVDRAALAVIWICVRHARLREARARRALAEANLSPTLTGSANASRSRSSAESGSGRTLELYDAGFDAAWEPDVFGGQRRALEAAQADLERSVAGLHDTQVSLTAELALNYVDVRAFQTRLAIARSNLASQTETLQLTEWRTQAGLATALDTEQARTAVEQTRALIPALETGLTQAGHRIAILLGQAPTAVQARLRAPAAIPAARESVAIGIPADTLRRRPDVRAAERQLAAETARIGQASAARYPDFTLRGSIGLEALSLGALGSSDALFRSLLAGVSGVLFDGGRIERQIEIQEAVRDQARVSYEAVVLTALQDVENALTSLANSSRRQAALSARRRDRTQCRAIRTHRYAGGVIDFRRCSIPSVRCSSLKRASRVRAPIAQPAIRLYKALGGGWSAG
jgi:NodT family efflux transporter outer membrane factor (OMF) lipoprotein